MTTPATPAETRAPATARTNQGPDAYRPPFSVLEIARLFAAAPDLLAAAEALLADLADSGEDRDEAGGEYGSVAALRRAVAKAHNQRGP